jgi:hypothetical protein
MEIVILLGLGLSTLVPLAVIWSAPETRTFIGVDEWKQIDRYEASAADLPVRKAA